MTDSNHHNLYQIDDASLHEIIYPQSHYKALPQRSDSNYVAVTRHRRPFSTAGRPPVLELVDDDWVTDTLSDDDVQVSHREAAVAPLLEEGELDADNIVSPTGSSLAATSSLERRRREDMWTDLGLDQLDDRLLGGQNINHFHHPSQGSSRSAPASAGTPAGRSSSGTAATSST